MRPLVLVRTAIVFVAGIRASFALSSSGRYDNESDIISRSAMTGIISIGTTNHSIVPDKGTVIIVDKNDEPRGGSQWRSFAQTSREFPHLGLPLELENPGTSLHDITNPLKHLVDAVKTDEKEEVPYVASLLNHDNWRALIKTVDFTWEDSKTREEMFHHCLSIGESPNLMFDYMKVSLLYTSGDTRSIDPKLLWWFDYIKEYRSLDDASTVATATSGTATRRQVFTDEKLFAFLVNKYVSQTGEKDISLAAVSYDTIPPDARPQVVALFESLRRESTMKEFAEHMQLYLISMSKTKPLVLDAWLQACVSPKTIYDILCVADELALDGSDNIDMFTLWLSYVRAYWEYVSPDSAEKYFHYAAFLGLVKEKSSLEDMTTVFASKSFRQVLKTIRRPSFGNPPSKLPDLGTSWLWLFGHATPQAYLSFLNPSGKFELGDPVFLQGVSFINLYKKVKMFTYEEVFNLLNPANSVEEIVGLFRWIQSYWWLQDLADGMLEYISNPSTVLDVLQMTPTKYWQIFLSDSVENTEDYRPLSKWFQYAVAYIVLKKDKTLALAVSMVYELLKNNLPDNRRADVFKAIEHNLRATVRSEMLQHGNPRTHKKLRSDT